MAQIQAVLNQCDDCGHIWIPSGKPALQCPTRKCRSRSWNASGIVVAAAVPVPSIDTPKVKMNAAMATFMAKQAIPEAVPEPIEQAMCTHSEWSEELGERIACGLPAHSAKSKHGNMRVMG